MSPLARVLLVFAAVVTIVLVIISMQPGTFHVQREIDSSAPQSAMFAEVADFHRWSDWSPWDKLDAAQKKTFAGTPGTVGSTYEWAGNDKIGEGKMTVTDVHAPEKIDVRLQFIKPFPADNMVTFTFTPKGTGTHAVWAMDGKTNFMGKAIHMLMDMDKMVGPDFEKGLQAMKEAAEKSAQPASQPASRPAK